MYADSIQNFSSQLLTSVKTFLVFLSRAPRKLSHARYSKLWRRKMRRTKGDLVKIYRHLSQAKGEQAPVTVYSTGTLTKQADCTEFALTLPRTPLPSASSDMAPMPPHGRAQLESHWQLEGRTCLVSTNHPHGASKAVLTISS